MSRSFDVIVVGVGGMGSAACYHLARRGVRVLGLEQFGIPNVFGSSHGHSRLIRMAYYEHPDYVPLLRRSYELWNALQDEFAIDLLTITGGLYIGPQHSRLVSGSLEAARLHDLPHQELSSVQVAARFPQFHLPAGYGAMYEEPAGILQPDLAVSTHARGAISHGAELRGHEPVLDWTASSSGVQVTTSDGVYTAQRVVFCGGPWTTKLVADLGVPLTVTRQLVVWLACTSKLNYDVGAFPAWAMALEDESLYYGTPQIAARPGIKVAHHKPGAAVDPDRVNRNVNAGEMTSVIEGIQRLLPDLSGPVLSIDVCLYTNSPDGHFLVDRHPQQDNVIVACGFSGHGFKFVPVMGEALADLALNGTTSLPIGFLGFSRFASLA